MNTHRQPQRHLFQPPQLRRSAGRGRVTLKGVALGLLAALLLSTLGLCAYVFKTHPMLDGRVAVAGLSQPVAIERDQADVTHIKADNLHDAYWSMGYVHAQERSWQLELNRRLMHGLLAEILGQPALDTDKLMRTLGIMQAARAQHAGLPHEARAALQAYADGINAFHASASQALPPEFHLLRVKPGVWQPEDSVGWAIMMALDLGGNWGNEMTRLGLSRSLPTDRVWDLVPAYPGRPPATTVDFAALYRNMGLFVPAPAALPSGTAAQHTREAPQNVAVGVGGVGGLAVHLSAWAHDLATSVGENEGKGSNNWVLDGRHTQSGKPLLANDPHLGLSAPAIWYFAALHVPGRLNVVGATLPGMPFVVLGRTENVAWGFTNTGPDVQDVYIEQINPLNPKQYRVPSLSGDRNGGQGAPAWADFDVREESIPVKGEAMPTVLTVRSTRHGPVLSDGQAFHAQLINTQKYVLALRWAALDADNQTVRAGLEGNFAQSVGDILQAYRHYHSPMQSVVVADTAGRIHFQAVGKVPVRKPGNDLKGVAPAPGWLAQYDWDGWIAFDNTPQDAGANKGWVATANQDIRPSGYTTFMGDDWAVPYRHKRIEQLLAGQAGTPQTVASMQRMQADVVSLAAARLLPQFKAAAVAAGGQLPTAFKTQLAQFAGEFSMDSGPALVFAVWVDELARGLIEPRLEPEQFGRLYGKRHFRGVIEQALESNDAFWCGSTGCRAASQHAMERALARIVTLQGPDAGTWRWGSLHKALSQHRPFGNVAALARWFDVSEPSAGDTFTVNVGQYWPNDPKVPFANRHAASLRAVYDLADLDKSQFIYQTGQSGLVWSSRYRDMAADWAAVKYRPLQLTPATMAHQLTLTPASSTKH
jgi:penicillin G amidase